MATDEGNVVRNLDMDVALDESKDSFNDSGLNDSGILYSTTLNKEFDTDEEEQEFDTTPLHLDWVDLTSYEMPAKGLAISSLPGCRFSKVWRSLERDIETIKEQGFTNVMTFLTRSDLQRYRVVDLLEKYASAGLEVHDFPHEDMIEPDMGNLLKMFEVLEANLNAGKKTLMHCCAGLGRSCVVAACFMLIHNAELKPEVAIEQVRAIRGHRAVQSVKQFNFITDFRQELKDYNTKLMEEALKAKLEDEALKAKKEGESLMESAQEETDRALSR